MSTQNKLDFLTDETLHEAYEVEVKSKNGKPVRFGELVAGKGESITTIVVFSKLVTSDSSCYAISIQITLEQ